MYKVLFEVDVDGLASVKRFEGELYIKADTPKAARDKADVFIESAYSDNFAIFEVLPVPVIE